MKSVVRQGGSVKIFIIAGVVLALIALGVLYGVKRLAMNDQTPPMVVPSETEGPQGDEDTDSGVGQSQGQSSDEGQVQDGLGQIEGSNGSVGEGGDSSSGGNESLPGDSTDSSQLDSGGVANLPQSGPSEGISALGLGVLVASFVAYRRSLRHL